LEYQSFFLSIFGLKKKVSKYSYGLHHWTFEAINGNPECKKAECPQAITIDAGDELYVQEDIRYS
jgi:hypothetical protein